MSFFVSATGALAFAQGPQGGGMRVGAMQPVSRHTWRRRWQWRWWQQRRGQRQRWVAVVAVPAVSAAVAEVVAEVSSRRRGGCVVSLVAVHFEHVAALLVQHQAPSEPRGVEDKVQDLLGVPVWVGLGGRERRVVCVWVCGWGGGGGGG